MFEVGLGTGPRGRGFGQSEEPHVGLVKVSTLDPRLTQTCQHCYAQPFPTFQSIVISSQSHVNLTHTHDARPN